MTNSLVRLWRLQAVNMTLLCVDVRVYGEEPTSSWRVREYEAKGWSRIKPDCNPKVLRRTCEST